MNLFSKKPLRRSLIPALFSVFVMTACDTPDTEPKSDGFEQFSGYKLIEKPIVVAGNAGKVWKIFGLEIAGKIMSAETNGQYSVIISSTPPNGGPPPHVHENEDELFYVVEGEYEFKYGDETVVVSKDAVVVLPRKIPHSFRNIGETTGKLLNTITPGGFEQFFEEVDQLPKDAPLDRAKVQEIGKKYGLTFLPPPEAQ